MDSSMREKNQREERTMKLKIALSKVLVLQTPKDLEGVLQVLNSQKTSTLKRAI